MAETRKRKKKNNDLSPELYPLWTEDETLRIRRLTNLYTALTYWGGSIDEWAESVGVSKSRVKDWLSGKHNMRAENVDKTCELFGVSRDYLLGEAIAYYGLLPHPTSEPTMAERDRMDSDSIKRGYEKLDEEGQRIVTSIVVKLLNSEHTIRYQAMDERFYKQIILGYMYGDGPTEEQIEWFKSEVFEPGPPTIEEHDQIGGIIRGLAKKELEDARSRFERQQGQQS